MDAKACLSIDFPSLRLSRLITESLKPETKNPLTERSKVCLERKGKVIRLSVEAKDTVALRASLNSYLRWMISIATVLQALEEE